MKEETAILVLKTYETHFPYFFRDKTKEDKALFTADWLQIFGEVDDDTFLKACGKLAKESDYFPSTKEIFKTIDSVKTERELEVNQLKYKLVDMITTASMTDEEIAYKVWFETEVCGYGDPLTTEFFEAERKNALDYLKTNYDIDDALINKFAETYKNLKTLAKKEAFRNKLYDYLQTKKRNNLLCV